MTLEQALKEHWGFESLRPLQSDVVDAAGQGQDAVVVMPTGGGKSLCYQVPPLVDGGLTVVVSPLLSLMKDQVDGLRMVGYPSAALNSQLTVVEEAEVAKKLEKGEISLIYLSPERALRQDTVALLRAAHNGAGPKRFAIDEAHCISNWGHDFRPEYRQLSRLRSVFPDACVHALTATAAPLVRDDIAEQLGLRSPSFFIGCFDRKNLTYRIVPKVNKLRQIAAAVSRHEDEASIVYCISRKDTEEIAEGLVKLGLNAVAYHAGLDGSLRRQISEDFAQERVNVVVATVAFGMGIDRANVRCVVHESMPRSIESYQQETGRAGRDGLPSECLLLYAPADVVRWERLIRDSDNQEHVEHQLALMDEVRKFCVGTVCRHKFLSEYFGQEYGCEKCDACDLCLEGWEAASDSTRTAHKILHTVMDLQRLHRDFFFGARHIAAVMTGSHAKEVLKHGHEKLRGHGSLDMTVAKAQSFVDQLVDLGLLRRTGGDYPSVALTQAGVDALVGRAEVLLRDLVPEKPTAQRTSVGDRGLYEELRQLRREIASEKGVAVDNVLPDAALINIAKQRPLTAKEFAKIAGIGDARAREFGPRFLALLREAAIERKDRTSVNTYEKLSPLFAKGYSVAKVADEAGLAQSTVGPYLAQWIEQERVEDVTPWVSASVYEKAARQFEKHGVRALKPVFQALGGEVSYDALHVVRAHWSAHDGVLNVREKAVAYA